MKRIFPLFCVLLLLASSALAAPLGRASADFDNSRPQKNETAFGRLAADAIRAATNADIALINAGAFNSGVLRAGEVTKENISALLSFPKDEVATITITGAQLRAALERAVQAYPTGSPAFLHGAGFSANFNTQAPTNERLTMLRIAGREVQNGDSISVAMPMPLVSGNSGYFTIWPNAKAIQTNISLADAIGELFKEQGNVAPDNTPRLAPQ
jgi:2',3'-cyclic-nucleotide 2'-phosphodiesterase (5'-nucleotidase family)